MSVAVRVLLRWKALAACQVALSMSVVGCGGEPASPDSAPTAGGLPQGAAAGASPVQEEARELIGRWLSNGALSDDEVVVLVRGLEAAGDAEGRRRFLGGDRDPLAAAIASLPGDQRHVLQEKLAAVVLESRFGYEIRTAAIQAMGVFESLCSSAMESLFEISCDRALGGFFTMWLRARLSQENIGRGEEVLVALGGARAAELADLLGAAADRSGVPPELNNHEAAPALFGWFVQAFERGVFVACRHGLSGREASSPEVGPDRRAPLPP